MHKRRAKCFKIASFGINRRKLIRWGKKSMDEDPDPVIFGPPDPDPVLYSTDPDPDPTCNNEFIYMKLFLS